MADLPTVRWGIVATGMISQWFVTDILKPDWPGKRANHVIVAIGSSSIKIRPTLYGSYQEVYDDRHVDCVYIGTPHSFHKQNCLDAIRAGKNVLCEKPFTINAEQAFEVFSAAQEKGVFVMEAMWTRFFPLVRKLQEVLFEEKKLGTIYRTFCDFAQVIDIASLPDDNRYKDPALGAGSLLDIGIYSLTWATLTLTDKVGNEGEDPDVQAIQTMEDGVDVASSMLLRYPSTGRHGICTSTTSFPGHFDFARIEGSEGHITIHGPAPSAPEGFVFHPKERNPSRPKEHYHFEKPGRGFFWEADAVAHDIAAGRTQSEIMPWAETMRMMTIMDMIRQRGGARFPVDSW